MKTLRYSKLDLPLHKEMQIVSILCVGICKPIKQEFFGDLIRILNGPLVLLNQKKIVEIIGILCREAEETKVEIIDIWCVIICYKIESYFNLYKYQTLNFNQIQSKSWNMETTSKNFCKIL